MNVIGQYEYYNCETAPYYVDINHTSPTQRLHTIHMNKMT